MVRDNGDGVGPRGPKLLGSLTMRNTGDSSGLNHQLEEMGVTFHLAEYFIFFLFTLD